jgi:hypothetical protein
VDWDRTKVAEPAELPAVMVYVVSEVTVEGVPEIWPLLVFRLNPLGKAGATEYASTVPVTTGLMGVIACVTTRATGLG